MTRLAHVGDMLALHARLFPDKIGASDLERKMTFRQWYARACQLANALTGIGLVKGDRVCVLAYNCLEWLEIYAATALNGLVAVPINFRLTGPEIRYIVDNCQARALIVQGELLASIESVRHELLVPPDNFIFFGTALGRVSYRSYENLIAQARDSRPDIAIASGDPWTLMYTSGTTGSPKGAIRSHRGSAMLSLVTEIELSLSRHDAALLVMPMCHANSLYLLGASTAGDQARHHGLLQEFRPVRAVRLDRGRLGDNAASGRTVLQARLGRARMRRLAPDPPARQQRQRGARRRSRRAILLQRLHLRWLLEAAGENTRSLPRQLLHSRGHSKARPRGVHLPRRPQEQCDNLRRREHLPFRSRGTLGRAREGQICGGSWPTRCHLGRARARGGRATRRHAADRSGDRRLVQDSHRRLQAAALSRLHQRPGNAAHCHGQDPASSPSFAAGKTPG